MTDSFSQYSRTFEHYSRFRPRYPQALADLLRAECGLDARHVVADVGSGTGQMTELFLKQGNRVYAVESNADMRAVAEVEHRGYPLFASVDGTAETTGLPDRSVDFVTVGNAFHWFDHARTRQEFERVLVPGGWAVLAWNLERKDGSEFYEDFVPAEWYQV